MVYHQKQSICLKVWDAELTPAAWALKWLWNQKEVTVLLSGMNDDAQLSENLHLANGSTPDMLTEKEMRIFDDVTEAFRSSYKIPCNWLQLLHAMP